MPQSMNNYINKAKDAIDGGYAARLQQLQAARNNQLAEYDQNAIDTNASYDRQLKDNADAGLMRVNNYNNDVLGRGMARSSIATTGIAGINNETAGLENDIKLDKQNKLNQISRARQVYDQNYDSGVAALTAEQQSAINKYAQDLYNNDLTYERQRALQAQQAAQQAAKKAASPTEQLKQAKDTINSKIDSIVDSGDRLRWLEQNQANIISSLGGNADAIGYYNSLIADANKYSGYYHGGYQHA